MATKSSKKSQPTTIGDRVIAREMIPAGAVVAHTGSEPLFAAQPDLDRRPVALMRAFNWYSSHFGRKEAKEMMASYADYTGQTALVKHLRRVDDREVMTTLGWLARLAQRGLELTEAEKATLNSELNRLVKTTAKAIEVEKEEKPQSNRPNVQEIMREKASEAAGEFEGVLDEFVMGEITSLPQGRIISTLSEKNILPQHISILTEVWSKKIKEFELAYSGKDQSLTEGYSNFTKTQLKNLIKFCEAVVADLNGYASVKKAASKPRLRKAVPVEKIVSKLKYLKTFEDPAAKLKLESVHPSKLHGASEAWVYDTSKRKLHHYVADEYSKTFTVKGNTLLGFDTAASEVKTLRKPGEQIKEVMGSKPAARKYFKDIKAVSTTPNGRFNEQMIILKAW
jgi:hypothetical protein